MKVQRYLYGGTNVGQLQSGRSALRSPQEVAAEAAAPYQAGAEVAGAISQDLFKAQERIQKEEDEADAMASALNVARYKSATDNSAKQAVAENWTPEQYEADIGAINKAFAGSSELINERNRPEIDKAYLNTIAMQGETTQRISYGIQRGQQTEDYAAQRAEATKNKDWETVSFLDAMANKSGLIDDAQLIEVNALNEGQMMSESLMEGYREASMQGGGDEFLLKVSKMDLSPEAEKIFSADRAQYDKLTKALANDVRQEQGLKLAQYYQYGITRSTTPDEITAFIRENRIYDQGQISKLYGRLESIKDDESVINSDNYNPASKTDRKAFNELLPTGPDVTEQEVFEASMGIALQRTIAPEWLDGYFNRGAYNTDNAQEFAQVAENYHSYVMLTDRLPVTITEEARARFEMYHDLRQANTGSGISAGLVLTAQKALTEDAFEANLAAYDDPAYGVDNKMTPETKITELVEQKIKSDTATRFGLNVTDAGIFWDTKKMPPIPPGLRREMNRVGRNMWGYTTNEEVAANAEFGALRASGWAATDANEGVTAPDGTKMGLQYMKNPPEKPFAITRAEMGADIQGRKYQVPGEYQEGTARYNWREVDPLEVELGEGQVYTNDENQQKTHYPMLVNGEQLLYREDGETKLEFFEYGEQPRVNEEDFQVIEEAHRRASEEGVKRSTNIDPGLQF